MNGDISIEEAVEFFRNAGFLVLTDEDFPDWGGCSDDDLEDEE